MKGDFTRSTFRPEKQYTSVRMQQGRLQLDSDWNEQADIQAYLYHTQIVDLIGAESGVPTSEGDTNSPNRDSFLLSGTPEFTAPDQANSTLNDLAIMPGHLYVNGTLCELGGTPFEFIQLAQQTPSLTSDSSGSLSRVTVSTLRVDGQSLQIGQWVELIEPIQVTNEGKPKAALFQIQAIDSQKLELTLLGTVPVPAGKMRRRLTYRTQPDYPNPEPVNDGFYLVYLDVWQRHITAIDDPEIREVALINTPDTTTRTKTVWQLKLQKFDQNLIELVAHNDVEKKDLLSQFDRLLKILQSPPENLTDSEFNPDALIKTVWQRFLAQRKGRSPLMTACARLCATAGGASSNGNGYRRLENQLYRVEIHDPGTVGGVGGSLNGQPESPSAAIATFKWSRDNGSVVSPIEKIQDNQITIRKSSQDAWSTSKSGQWIEITTAEMELKGERGVMAPLMRVSDTKIEFNRARTTGPIPPNASKVRRWDQTTQTATLPTRADWINLDSGINIKFDPNSVLETGDYWLIPARSATNDIEWPTDQAELSKRQPLAQPPLGIHHDYCLLAFVQVEAGQFPQPNLASDASDATPSAQTLKDYRLLFPPLFRCLDTTGGTITGDLFIEGKLGIGTGGRAIARLHTQGAAPIPGTGTLRSNGTTLTGEKTQFRKELHPGDLLHVGSDTRLITEVQATTLTIDRPLSLEVSDAHFSYQQPTAYVANRENQAQFVVLSNGNIGIGTNTPKTPLEVTGTATADTWQGKRVAIAQDPTSLDSTLYGSIQLSTSTPRQLEFKAYEQANFQFIDGRVGIGAAIPNALLDVNANLIIDQSYRAVSIQPKIQTSQPNAALTALHINPGFTGAGTLYGLIVERGLVGLGTLTPKNQLDVKGGVVIGDAYAGIETAPTNGLKVQGTIGTDRVNSNYLAVTNSSTLNTLKLKEGGTINKFSTDNTLGSNSDDAVPTEKAVKGYVDEQIQQVDGRINNLRNHVDGEIQRVDGRITDVQNNVNQQIQRVDGRITDVQNNVNQQIQRVDGRITDVQNNVNQQIKRVDGDIANVQTNVNQQIQRVDGRINTVNNTLETKADQNYVDQRIDAVSNELSAKADLRYVDQRLTGIQSNLDNKANRDNVNDRFDNIEQNLETKTNKQYVDSELDELRKDKANKNGSPNQDFKADTLEATKVLVEELSTRIIDNVKVLTADKVQSRDIFQVSSGTLKDLIDDLSSQEAKDALDSLNPVKFIFKTDESRNIHAGFIAENTHPLLTSPDHQAIKILDVVAVLTKAVKDSQEVATQLVEQVTQQQQELTRLENKVKSLETEREQRIHLEEELKLLETEREQRINPQNIPRAGVPQPLFSSAFNTDSNTEVNDLRQAGGRRRSPRRTNFFTSLYRRMKHFFRQLLHGKRNPRRTL